MLKRLILRLNSCRLFVLALRAQIIETEPSPEIPPGECLLTVHPENVELQSNFGILTGAKRIECHGTYCTMYREVELRAEAHDIVTVFINEDHLIFNC